MHTGPQPLFILGFARSGTTLLQRLLNSYDDVLIWGEHVGFLRDVANAYALAWRNPDYFASTVPLEDVLVDSRPLTRWQAWMNWTTPEEWRRLYREFLEAIFVPGGLPGRRVWGWKEVHYLRTAHDGTLPFLAELFPEARYVFVVRNGFDTMASFSIRPLRRSLAAWKHEGCLAWTRTVDAIRWWHDSGRLDSYLLRYEDLIEGRGELLRLLASLGKRLGDEQVAVLRAETARGSSFAADTRGERWKQLSMLRRGIAFACLAATNRELGYENPHVPLGARIAARAVSPVLAGIYYRSGFVRRAREILRDSGPASPPAVTAPLAVASAAPGARAPHERSHATTAAPSTTQRQ